MRPAIGVKVALRHSGERGTVVPTGKRVPADEVNVMLDETGSVRTVHLASLVVLA